MADIEKVEDVVKGLDAKQKEKVATFLGRQKEKLAKRMKENRIQARQSGVIVGTVVSLVGGVAAEGVRRKVVGRWAVECQNQGIALTLVGLAFKFGAKYAGIPILQDLGDSIISQGGSVGSAELIYGKEDALVVALKNTTHAAEHPEK